ncbi:hypothetical protein JMM81_16840 [Bacillus sp. V3B]|uniref:hypothetical protein n=1 Tax=Bacillus sp. V3B TaxID=2804915 RepID=UPI00210F05D7|nr:hypothetical protein [Bacillus sp. V3B]MCQ6276581.1 hypothetical protein [Bacillus sp. V3B]
MKELVGTCCECGKNLYCLDGFFNGVLTAGGKTICFDCTKQKEKSANQLRI